MIATCIYIDVLSRYRGGHVLPPRWAVRGSHPFPTQKSLQERTTIQYNQIQRRSVLQSRLYGNRSTTDHKRLLMLDDAKARYVVVVLFLFAILCRGSYSSTCQLTPSHSLPTRIGDAKISPSGRTRILEQSIRDEKCKLFTWRFSMSQHVYFICPGTFTTAPTNDKQGSTLYSMYLHTLKPRRVVFN